jgi:hypothetical protein
LKAYTQQQSQPQQETSFQCSPLPQRTIVNPALSVLPQANVESSKVCPGPPLATTRFAHDFSRIPVHSTTPANKQAKAAHEQLQARRVEANDAGKMTAPPIVYEAQSSSGLPLDTSTRGFMESRFGHDFSRVRVHTDARAGDAASAIGARAFTMSHDIVFGAGEYAPQTESGLRLLSHELTHVVQQRAGVRLTGGVGQSGDAYERHADAAADRIAKGQRAEGILEPLGGKLGTGAPQPKASAAIQLQPVSSKQSASGTINQSSNVQTKKGEPTILPEVTITAEKPKSGDEIISMIESLQDQLLTATSITRKKLIVGKIKSLFIQLESAPISPTPKRDFVAGPVKFGEFGQYFYQFGFETMQDKHWRKGWDAVYKLAVDLFAGPFSVVLDLCDLFLSSEREEREEAAVDILKDKALDEISEKGVDVGKFMIRQGASKGLAKGVAIPLKGLSKAVSIATDAYELYKANTEGPSSHDAALETTAMIMSKVYGNSDGRDGVVRKGGFIPTPTTSYCRVARQQAGPFPQIKDRRLAFDLMGNRVYERMRNLIAPKHIESPEAFYAFRTVQMNNAWNTVAAAGGDLEGRKVRLVQGKEKQLEEMEEMAELWKKTPVDLSKPFKPSTSTISSDRYSNMGNTINQRYGLKRE